jgi:hypothetical protein
MTLVDLRGGGAVLMTMVPNNPPVNNIAAIATPNNDFFMTTSLPCVESVYCIDAPISEQSF